ncbi:MAG TPA: Wzz/FepE/Etk N-terminal domain-containing protein [Bryobacteraceae bacterium]|nr:Wzz/FepE/Etk N-terminal domain-containing protein [Bryobacteraceae bacterium]
MVQTAPEAYGAVPRRPLDIEDYIDIIRRHKAWILGPAFGALVVAVVVAFLWPDTYVSSAVIRVVPPSIPETFVPSNVNIEMSQRINSMAQTILSRGNLTNIINTYDLYRRDRQRKPMEDVVEDMRHAIRIGNVVPLTQNRGVSAFSITYSYDNRIMAQKVCADLVSRFISENTRDRTTGSVNTTTFLRDQLEAARKELQQLDENLSNYRMQNNGRLPEQVQSNLSMLGAAENRIANLNAGISRIGQEKLLLETELRTTKNQMAAISPGGEIAAQGGPMKSEAVAQLDREIERSEMTLASLRERYKENYPDVRAFQSQIDLLKRKRAAVIKEEEEERANTPKEQPKPTRAPQHIVRELAALQGNVDRIESQIRTKDMQAREYQDQIRQAEQDVRVIKARIEAQPVSEKQYAEVIRDREVAKMKYDDLNRKVQSSRISEEVEKRQQGETLELLDPASLPQTPTEPKRPFLIGVGLGMGAVAGLVLAGAREAKDSSLKNLKDVRAYTQLTILGSIPLLENDLVVRRRRRLAWLAWSTACLVGVIVMTSAVLYYYQNKL